MDEWMNREPDVSVDQSSALILFSYGSAGDGGLRKQCVMCRKVCVRELDKEMCMNLDWNQSWTYTCKKKKQKKKK